MPDGVDGDFIELPIERLNHTNDLGRAIFENDGVKNNRCTRLCRIPVERILWFNAMHNLWRNDAGSDAGGHIVRDQFVQFSRAQAEFDIDLNGGFDRDSVPPCREEFPIPHSDQCIFVQAISEALHNLEPFH